MALGSLPGGPRIVAVETPAPPPGLWGSLPRRTAAALGLALGACLVVGVGLRILAMVAWWPVATTSTDSWPYAYYAGGDLLANPQHPAGYSLFLALGGLLTHSVEAFVVTQHLFGLAAALVLLVAVWRLCGSPWPGLAAAAVVLLGADQVHLEHTIMSEALFVLLLAVALYAIARAFEAPERLWPWPAIAGLLVALAALTRSAGLLLIPVFALGLALAGPRPGAARWRSPAAFLGTSCALLLIYAGANAVSHDRFQVAPTPGWHLYARVAPFADCGQFDPPPGTKRLCEHSSPADRLGSDWYLYDASAPAAKVFGQMGVSGGSGDAELGAFAREAVIHQPKTYLQAIWADVEAYFLPGGYEWKPGRGADLDGQLDWTGSMGRESERATERGMESFFDDFSVDRDAGLLGLLHDYQRVFRFGATALTFATLLILAGLFVGPRRNRIAVLVLGGGGLAMFVLPTLVVVHVARYTVPPAALIVAGATLSAMSVAPLLRSAGVRVLASARPRRTA